MTPIRFFSLFAGIGGLDLGFERAGLQCVGQCEINPFCLKVLEKHWPRVWRHSDIRTLTGSMIHEHCGPIDVLAGGFPCQDVSVAGRKVGIGGDRSGLWSEFYRILFHIRPPFAIVENTPGLLDRGFGRVLGDLAEGGYDAEWFVLSACAFGAPHTRERVFILAYPASRGSGQLRRLQCTKESNPRRHLHWKEPEPPCERVAHGVPDRLERLSASGNAVSPIVAEWIGHRLIEHVRAAGKARVA